MIADWRIAWVILHSIMSTKGRLTADRICGADLDDVNDTVVTF